MYAYTEAPRQLEGCMELHRHVFVQHRDAHPRRGYWAV
jgi:hypothetical protein